MRVSLQIYRLACHSDSAVILNFASMAKAPNKFDDKEILEKLSQDFHELVSNEDALHSATKHFLKNTIDELTLGIIFDLHRKFKTGSYDIVSEEDDPDDEEDEEIPGGDIFGHDDFLKKAPNCTCPNCGRAVAATILAPHLAVCMGIRRPRNMTRRVASGNNNSKDREVATFSGVPSDDEDDMDWNSGNKRGKKKKKNGSKKSKDSRFSGGTPKKLGDPSKSGDFGVDVDQDDDSDLSNLRDLLQDHSNSSSPADSASSTQSTASTKEKEKTKKKNKRDRSSPSSSISAE